MKNICKFSEMANAKILNTNEKIIFKITEK